MTAGFFTSAEVFTSKKHTLTLIPKCGICQLHKHCHSPKMKPTGEGRRKILVCGEAPGYTEDSKGKQFVGDSGQLLRTSLRKFGIELERDCWVTNSIICHPKKDGKNRTPTDKELTYCQPNLINTINELKPQVIIPLGGSAVKNLMRWLWKEDVGRISRWDGWRIPNQRLNAYVCPTWHPSYIMRNDYGSQKENEVRRFFFEKHLKAACKIDHRPWKSIPNFKAKLEVIIDPNQAAKKINKLLSSSATGPIAWDLETDRLKPDSTDAEIYCCSLSDGETSFAFPWHGDVIAAMREFLLSSIPKIGYNCKFESRWVYKEFGIAVNNWLWDGMLAAHVLDNRPNICSCKFQAFVLLGVDSWDEHIKPFLKAKDTNSKNRIKEAPLYQVLEYCAMDSLVEWYIAKKQMKLLGVFNGPERLSKAS